MFYTPYNTIKNNIIIHLTVQVSCPPPWASFFVVVVALTNHWTVGYRTVQPLYSLTQHYPTYGKLDTGLSDHWTVGKSTV